MMFLGVDLGTSSVKAVLLNELGQLCAQASAPLRVYTPFALHREQEPADWVKAAEQAVLSLPADLRAQVQAIGLSGQMHGATLLDKHDKVLRPAILWNDGRAAAQCRQLENGRTDYRQVTGNKAMPGFTAPKLRWVQQNEPDVFANTSKVLLPKDYLRLVWTGEYATDMSDASGTLWLDIANRQWNKDLLEDSDLSVDHMPELYEGPEITGAISAPTAAKLGIPNVPVVAGGGDQAAGAIGANVLRPGDTSLALGTSGVLFTVTDRFLPNADNAAHAFCHALPHTWHQMGVCLAAASALQKAAELAGFASVVEAVAAAESSPLPEQLLFMPYINGERTPHDNPSAVGSWHGITSDTRREDLINAALIGIGFAFADMKSVLNEAGSNMSSAVVIGGGARSRYWGSLLASILNMDLEYHQNAEVGPAEGAALLAGMGQGHRILENSEQGRTIEYVAHPHRETRDKLMAQLDSWRTLYQQTKSVLKADTSS